MRNATLPVALVLLASCGSGEGASDPAGAEAAAVPAPPSVDDAAPVDSSPGGLALEARSARGTFAIALEPEGGAIPLNEPFAMRVLVTDTATGEPLTGADEITFDARMPTHGHGMLRDVELAPADPADPAAGQRAEGVLLHMVGPWEFHVDVRRGARRERAQVAYELTL